MKKIIIPILSLIITLILVITLTQNQRVFANEVVPRDKLTEHAFDAILPLYDESEFITYHELRTLIDGYILLNPSNPGAVVQLIENNVVLENKVIRFDTAQELYRFSVDVSFLDTILYELETTKLDTLIKDKLLDLDYVLGADIDYAVMKSKQFVPIGYEFETIGLDYYEAAFTGTFNGQGFEISNLYVAGYSSLYISEGEFETEIDTVITEYYAMFSHNKGIITNLGLIDPTFELRTDHDDLTKAANLVGLNQGSVTNVYVIDQREPSEGGIRMRTPTGASSVSYEAAGVVFHNMSNGHVSYAYFAAKTVVNQSNINAFDVQPVVYINDGTISHLVYDSTIYLTQITVNSVTINITTPNANHTGEATSTLKSSSSLGSNFYYYPEDRYPALYGLTYQNNYFEIHNALDFVYFNKLLELDSLYLNINYQSHQYRLMDHIDMRDVKPSIYKTPSAEFDGVLTGLYDTDKNYHIYNLEILNGVEIDGGYYMGLFSTLTGEVSHITFSNLELRLTNSNDYFNTHFYIGSITGDLLDGKIENILLDLNLDLGTNALGAFSIGSVTGRASGQIMGVYLEGSFDLGHTHTYNANQTIQGPFYVGGMVGRTGQTRLTLYNALNTIDLHAFGTDNTMTLSAAANLYVGGLIGYVQNTAIGHHDFGLLTNEGQVTVYQVNASQTVTQYVGGIIGHSTGIGYELNEYSGLWTNHQRLNLSQRGTNPVVAANILTSSHSQATEFIYLYNLGQQSSFLINDYNNFKYTTLIYHTGSGDITLSQSKNEAHVKFENSPHTHNYSGVYHSENSGGLLRFVENKGNITFDGFTTNQNFVLAGITTAKNTNFLSVNYTGNIAIYDVVFNPTANQSSSTYNSSTNQNNRNIWVSGITQTLSSGYYLKNSFNGGNIYLADIDASQNVYIGGLVNENLSGNLQSQDSAAQPKATLGIINSINRASIKSTLPATYAYSGYGFKGLGNIYAGGITTFNGSSNGGSIQDTINMGDIEIAQINLLSDSGVSDNVGFASTDNGGNVTNYRRGVVLGGIAAAVTYGYSRIYDSVNSGNVHGMSYFFARTGGVLATALRDELTSGNVNTSLYTSQSGSTSGSIGNAETILNSILSNGLNYGNISAITNQIGTYPTSGTSSVRPNYRGPSGRMYFHNATSTISDSQTTRSSTEERPGIRASSGGVIGYGLSTMKKMLNHGQISSTDVAGGVVGATVVLITLSVKIDTAINYGTVRAIQASSYTSFNKNNMDYTQIRNAFYDVNSTFIYPNTLNGNNIVAFPESKRGIGGVFGRLQRRLSQYMQISSGGIFDFVVNMDPNVDLIGRLDQVYDFSSSNRFFQFPNAIYYSAKLDDTTQSIFAGHSFFNNGTNSYRDITYDIVEQGRYQYRLVGSQVQRRLQHHQQRVVDRMFTGTVMDYFGTGSVIQQGTQTRRVRRIVSSSNWVNVTGTWENVSLPYLGEYSDPFWVNRQETYVTQGGLQNQNYNYVYIGSIPIPFVSENSSVTNASYIYDQNFIMRNDSTLVDGKPITSFIYYVENEILSERFINERLNGMYVLATSAGSQFGATLPANVVLDRLYQLNDLMPYDVDYDTLNISHKTPFSQDVIDDYESLYQTSLNDKSKLLTENQVIKLEQDGGSNLAIFGNNASVDNANNTIELRLNSGQVSSTPIIFKMIEALLPSNAMIAARLQDYDGGAYVGNPGLYRQLLIQDQGSNISDTAGPRFNITNTSNGRRSVGYFTSYSEAALDNDTFFTQAKYQTTYQVFITFYSGTGTPNLYDIFVNNATSYTTRPNTSVTNYSYGNTNISTALGVSFRYQNYNAGNSLVSLNFDVKDYIVLEYYDGANYHLVDKGYYTLTSTPMYMAGNHALFDFNIQFSSQLRGGAYRISYKYHANDTTLRTISFNRVQSSSALIMNLSHYSQAPINPTTSSFTSNVNFDYNGLNLDQIFAGSTMNPNIPAYLDNYTHSVSFLNQIKLTPFARISQVELISTVFNAGYKTYNIRYTLLNENGTTSIINHQIIERNVQLTNTYKDNIGTNVNNLFATREANQTTFGLNYNIDPTLINQVYKLETTSPNQYFNIEVTAVDTNNQAMPEADIVGITYSVTNRLNIIMSRETKPGRYRFVVTYVRGTQEISISPIIFINKNEGTKAYLEDIRFSATSQDTDYPVMSVANTSGMPIASPYQTSVYFVGIDYDGADENNITNFRIDGIVANIPLTEYVPLMIDYLPGGATISRKINPYEKANPGDPDWTPDVNHEIGSNADRERLQADFTLLPDGSEPSDTEEVIITYRVTSEDGNQVIYYHITVTDTIYNFSVIFEVYYVTINEQGLLENTVFNNETLIIDVTNFHALDHNNNLISIETFANTVATFPVYTSIDSIESNVTMLYSAVGESIYRFRFGRNKSGFYDFDVITPGYDYNYRIYFNGVELNASQILSGKYFYIQDGLRNRTRRFQVVIYDEDISPDLWGLYEYSQNWNSMN